MRKVLCFLALALVLFSHVSAQSCNAYFIYSETCPHCREMKPFVKELEKEFENLTVIWVNIAEDTQLAKDLAVRYNTSAAAVPKFIVGDKVFVGYSKARGELEYMPGYRGYLGNQNLVFDEVVLQLGLDPKMCQEPPIEPLERYPQWNLLLLIVAFAFTYPILEPKVGKRTWSALFLSFTIVVFFAFVLLTPEQYIREFADNFPFPLFVFIVAFADGFNPCAFTVLIILLSLLTHTKSRKKMMLIGGVFILTSAVMYFWFIMSLMFVGSWVFAKYGSLILKVLGVGVLVAGAVNLKDFFFFKKGISLTLSSDQQVKITKKASKVVRDVDSADSKKSLVAALLATAALAAFVNLVELGCTAILPAVYIATLFQTAGESLNVLHVAYTAFYSVVYVIPLFAILFNFIYYFKSDRVTQEQGKLLKLVGGVLMVCFGLVMLFKPQLLNF